MITEQMIIEAAKAHFLMPQNDDQLGIHASTLGSFAKYFYRKGLRDAAEKCDEVAEYHRCVDAGREGTAMHCANKLREMAQEVK